MQLNGTGEPARKPVRYFLMILEALERGFGPLYNIPWESYSYCPIISRATSFSIAATNMLNWTTVFESSVEL